MKEECIESNGIIVDIYKGDNFKVKLENEKKDVYVVCKPSGKIRQHNIRLIVGDKVRVELSPYDLSKGRIWYRDK